MKNVKTLGYARRLIYEQPHKESGLCCFSFACYLQKCVTQIYIAFYGDAMFVSFWGTQTCHWVLLLKRKIITLKLRHIERHVSSSANIVQLAKTKVITLLLTYVTAFSGCNFHVTPCKSLGIQTCSMTIGRTLSSWNIKKLQVPVGSFIWWNCKTWEGKVYKLILEYDYVTWKPRILFLTIIQFETVNLQWYTVAACFTNYMVL